MFHVEHETFHTLSCLACWVVSIHAHVKGATLPIRLTTKTHCFNPRAREGRDLIFTALSPEKIVSILAPARGATRPAVAGGGVGLFQSTRPRVARPCGRPQSRRCQSFNPRAREGRDLFVVKILVKLDSFNPRVREGRDPDVRSGIFTNSVFQSTRPRGTRLSPALWPSLSAVFQSTRPRGTRQRNLPLR